MNEADFDDRERVSLEDDYLRYATVLIDGHEYTLEKAEPDDPRPYPGYRPKRYGNVAGHTDRVFDR